MELNDRLSASAGLFYDLSAGNLGPWGTLTYKLDPNNKQSKSRIGGWMAVPVVWPDDVHAC